MDLAEGIYGVGGYVSVDIACNQIGAVYNAYGNYAHEQLVPNLTPSVSLSGANITVTPKGVIDSAYNTNYQFTAY